MFSRAFGRLSTIGRRVLQKDSKRCGHGHHEVSNPGPPVTLDLMPVPFRPYNEVYNELQTKFNIYLGSSVALFVAMFGLALQQDVFAKAAIQPPEFYRNRKN